MNFEDFYNASKKLHRIVEIAKTSSRSHLYSVSAMADSSRRGMQCTYASASAKLFLMEEAGFLDYLKDNMDIFSSEFVAEIEALFDQAATHTPK
jgi:hypothetical protein